MLMSKNVNNDVSKDSPIPSWFLKENGAIIATMLTHIFQESVDTGTVPDQCKEANFCPIFKKGKKSDPTNYRPVSLTCVACKVLENIIHSFIMKQLDKYNVLTDTQHGFRAKRGHDYLILVGSKLLSNEVFATICWRVRKFSATMASRFLQADEEFIEELRNTSEGKTQKEVRTTGLTFSNNGQRRGENMSNLKATKYQSLTKRSIILPFM